MATGLERASSVAFALRLTRFNKKTPICQSKWTLMFWMTCVMDYGHTREIKLLYDATRHPQKKSTRICAVKMRRNMLRG